MKKLLNPLIERTVNGVFGVDQYADVFESLAMRSARSAVVRRIFRHKVNTEIRQHPLLFIHVPKNGGTSIKRALYSSDPGHATVRYYEMLAPEVLDRATSFAVLRNPIDRFLSGFDFLMNGGGSDVTVQPAARRRLAHIRTIDDFLDHLEAIDNDWFKVDTIARPQWWYIVTTSGDIRVDKLWLLGEHNDDIAQFLAGYGFQSLSHSNKTRRSHQSLSSDQLCRLERVYEADFRLCALLLKGSGSGLRGKQLNQLGLDPQL